MEDKTVDRKLGPKSPIDTTQEFDSDERELLADDGEEDECFEKRSVRSKSVSIVSGVSRAIRQ